MIVLLNGLLGIGKSTLAEALVEQMARSVMLDSDALLAQSWPATRGGLRELSRA